MQKNGIVKRMIEIAFDNNYTVSSIERACGMTKGILQQASRRETGISTHNLELFLDNIYEVTKGRKLNFEYLLFGTLPKYNNFYKADSPTHYAKEETKQDHFEERLEIALDNKSIQKKLKEVLLLSQ
jgi:hypothetical protein